MHDRLIVFAYHLEAEPTIRRLGAKAISKELYAFEKGRIVITGLGAIRAGVVTAMHCQDVKEVWNLGLAGALSLKLDIGQIYQVCDVAKHVVYPKDLGQRSLDFVHAAHSSVKLECPGRRLVSTDHIVQSEQLREELAARYDLVDMEGYGIARACEAAQKPCRVWKIVSDYAGNAASDEIMGRLPALAERLADRLCQQLDLASSGPTSP